MAYYLWTGNYTQEAIQALVKEPQDREPGARKAVESAGGKLLHAFMALGKSDIVVLCEFPDDVNMAALSLVVGAAGSVTNAATTKLITMSEFSESLRIAGEVAGSYVPPQG